MDSFAKIAGWTIAGAVIVALLDKGVTGTNIQNILSGWAGVIKAITGGATAGTGTQSGGGSPQGGNA